MVIVVCPLLYSSVNRTTRARRRRWEKQGHEVARTTLGRGSWEAPFTHDSLAEKVGAKVSFGAAVESTDRWRGGLLGQEWDGRGAGPANCRDETASEASRCSRADLAVCEQDDEWNRGEAPEPKNER